MIKLYNGQKDFIEKNVKFIAIYDSTTTKLRTEDYQGICFNNLLIESYVGTVRLERYEFLIK